MGRITAVLPAKQGWATLHLFWNGSMPFLCRDLSFLPKSSYHENVSLAVYLPIFFFSFCQKTNLHLYKCSRLSLYLFTFFWRFRIKISCHNMFQFLKLHHMIWHELIWHFFTMLNLYSSIPRNVIIACSDMYNPVWKSYFIAQLPWQRNSINK